MTARFVRTFYLLWTPAEIVLVSDDPRGVVGAIELSRTSHRKMIQNLVWGAATRWPSRSPRASWPRSASS
ncbi:MAG: hypothetical protein M3Q38_08825, partial [Chloroflexota bacterium]|nr:hypothetical protein [Chloroflexota bacterium]